MGLLFLTPIWFLYANVLILAVSSFPRPSLRYDCGTSDQGMKGSMVEQGRFAWAASGQMLAFVSSTKSNAVWKPRIPGDSTQSSETDRNSHWNNHVANVHWQVILL